MRRTLIVIGSVVALLVVLFLAVAAMSPSDEVVTLAHRALSRDAYAAGALVAARWVARAAPGLHSMADVLPGNDS